jgi:glucose/arabinose dehydrogenase
MRLFKVLIALPITLVVIALLSFTATQTIPEFGISNFRVLFNTVTGRGVDSPNQQQLSHLVAATGFNVTLFAEQIPQARVLKSTPAGGLLVSSPLKGTVYLLQDNDHDGRADTRTPLVSGLNRPHGIDLYQDNTGHWLYIAETDAVGRVAVDGQTGKTLGEYHRLITRLPSGKGHWTRSIRFGMDGWLYLTVGSSCNVCVEKDRRRASMMRFRPDGSEGQIYATGLRNSVGFDWTPWDNSLYATDNGRDLLGDNFPPCELNLIQRDGFYGWPFINGFGKLDPDYGDGKEDMLAQSISPHFGFRAHNAPLGIHFLRYPNRPQAYKRAALVALHGSWNRSTPDGYKVISLHWSKEGQITSQDFLVNFLQENQKIIGRPVDIEEGPDGSIYISDDYAGVIYRVLYR